MKLAAYLSENKLTLAEFGRRLGVSHVTVHRWATEARVPSLARARQVQDATDGAVTLDDWPEKARESAA